MTGYPSVDKPWLKYYREEPIRIIKDNQTIYAMVFETNAENMDAPALEYFGREWTFAQMKTEVDKLALKFYSSGLRMGDRVLIGLPNCPEAVFSLLALNRIGCVSKWFDIRAGEKDIEQYANESRCKWLIAFEILIHKIEKIIDGTGLERVLIVSPADALGTGKRIVNAVSEIFKRNAVKLPADKRYVKFSKMLGTEEICDCNIPIAEADPHRPSIIIQSSGTTGKPKSIIHSDASAVKYTLEMAYFDLPIKFGTTVLNLLPPWIAFCIGGMIIAPLTVGAKVMLCPTLEGNEIVRYIGKFNVIAAPPLHYRYLHEHFFELSKRKIKAIHNTAECFISGGDKITVAENKAFEERFKTPVVNGYGNNEGWGCLTVNPCHHNRYGSVGIPKHGETVIAYDNENQQELKYGEVGEICFLCNTMFLEYENDAASSKKVKKLHSDGSLWLHTGDLGYIDQDGYVFLQGRIRRVIIRSAFKISAYTIEDKISEYPAVKECVAVEVKDETEGHVPMAFITVKDGVTNSEDEIIEAIKEKCFKELKEYEVPKYFEIVKSLPYTQNNKYDFQKLEKMGNSLIEK